MVQKGNVHVLRNNILDLVFFVEFHKQKSFDGRNLVPVKHNIDEINILRNTILCQLHLFTKLE